LATLKVLDRPYPAKNKEQAKAFQKDVSRSQQPRQVVLNEPPLPQSPEIETATLGAIFSNPEQGFAVFAGTANDNFFFSPVNRQLYSEANQFYSETGRLDLITVTAHLGDSELLKKLGGAGAVTDLFTGPTGIGYQSDMLPYYIEQLREKYVRRQAMISAFTTAKLAATNGDLQEVLQKMHRDAEYLNKLGSEKTLSDASICLNGHMPEMPPQIIHGVLHQGSKMVLGGTSKGRKTMSLIDLGVSVATGTEFWGFKTRKGPVCYINFEIQEPFFWFRVEQVCRAKGISIDPGMFCAWNLRGRATAIENLHDEIIQVLKSRPFVLDVIDPIYKALGDRDENRAGDVAGMLNQIEKIAVETEAAIAFGAHYSKGNQSMKESIDRIGGSGVFARDPDSIMTMTAHEDDECFIVESTLRNFPPSKPFVVRWDWPLFERDRESNPAKLKKVNKEGQFKQQFTGDMILRHLETETGTDIGVLKKKLDKETGMSKSTFYNLVKDLVTTELIVQRDDKLFKL
jgi:RecA-family ATPase